jgi:poly-gamma-glutamate capsule biosynthesis protein CapA/YwtB (metallophosphatase superfamily)
MKSLRLILLALLLASGLAGCSATGLQQPAGSSVFPDIVSFREARLRLPERHEPLCLVAVGDIMLSRYVAQKIEEHGDPGHPFAGVKWFIQEADLAFGNLEGPLTPGREVKAHEMLLRSEPAMAPALKEAGFNVLSLANNHVPDFGARGIRDTMRYLDKAGIGYAGAGRNKQEAYAPRYMEIKGQRLAFLAFNDPAVIPEAYSAGDGPGTAVLEPQEVAAAVSEAAGNADFTVVSLHAGTEYAAEPDDTQVRFARLAIDAGADLVLGNHPHVVQKVEEYRGKYIFYSLGNFIFDQFWSRETREGLSVKIWIGNEGVEKMEFLPVYINNDARPVPLSGQAGRTVVEKLGLELEVASVPAWDSENETFTTKEQYLFTCQKTLPESRLAQYRQFDMDNDGLPEYYTLRSGKLTVRSGSRLIWQSPDDWWVDYFFLGDADNDGAPELNLLVWKEGSFGPHRPFWVEEDDTSVKNHLFVFRLEKGSFKAVWQSSNLDCPIYRAALVDLDGDGENELLVTEGSYTDPATREITLWKWSGWGFYRINLY